MNVWAATSSAAADMRKVNTFNRTKKVVLCAILSALSFAVLYIGTLTGVFDLCAVVVGAVAVAYTCIEIKGLYPWGVCIVTFTLSLVLLPDKLVAFEYLFLGGVYPIIKAAAEGRKRVAEWIIKISYFNASVAAFLLLEKFVFASSEALLSNDIGAVIVAVAVVLLNAFFAFYDYALTRFISFYYIKLRKKLKINLAD